MADLQRKYNNNNNDNVFSCADESLEVGSIVLAFVAEESHFIEIILGDAVWRYIMYIVWHRPMLVPS